QAKAKAGNAQHRPVFWRRINAQRSRSPRLRAARERDAPLNRIFPSAKEWQTAARYGIIVAVAAFVVFNLRTFTIASLPFLLAYSLSLILEPVVASAARRLRIGRAWSALFVFLLHIVVGGLVLTWLAAILVQEIAS